MAKQRVSADSSLISAPVPMADAGHDFTKNYLPSIGDLVGPALQQEIAVVNKAVLNLCVTAARLGDAEPLAPALLGISREALEELANTGRSEMLLAQAHGLPLVELRIKDGATLQTILRSGFGSAEAVSALTKSMPLDLISKSSSRH